ncbi:amino acid adenylation domain-containing protein [Actinomycetes bacterium KLBMP 9759]
MTEMSAAKRAVLDRWKRGGANPPAATIARRAERGEAPLSSTQERVWYLDQLVPGSAAYNFSVAFRLDGRLDEPALRRALTEIVRRHDSLRATFPSTDGRARQLIAEPFEPEFTAEDLTGAPPERVRERMAAEAGRTLSLEKGPLIAALLLRLAPDRHVLQLTLHHIACDGWSLGVLNRELVTLYGAYTSGGASPLPELPIQYGDFAAWQQAQRAEGAFRADLDFWKRELAALPTLALPTDHPRPPVQRFRGARLELDLPQPLTGAVRDICKAADVTPYMFFLGAFTALLSRYSGQDDIAVGSPIANRIPVETEALIGYFSNTIVLRTDLAGDPSFRELLARIRQRTLEAYAHQSVPFEELVNELAPERDTSRNPLFQVMVVVQNAPLERVPFAGLDTRLDEIHTGTSKFDLWLQFMAVDDTWTVTFEYNTDLWDAPTISRMADHLTRLLTSVTTDPALAVSEIPLLGDEERHQVLSAFNDTAVDLGRPRPLHEHVEEQVRRTPDGVAVVFEGSTLTYRELDGRANALARTLIGAGVGPGALVGVHAERSAELVVALLAVLKSGGAYVPLEPSYPDERLEHMIRDTAAQAVLTDRPLPARLADRTPHVIRLGGAETAEAPAVSPSMEHPAYVIYTSGSTGQPKGAINSHRGIGNRLLWMQDAFGLTAEDKVLQKTPFSFDVSVWEFFWPLMTGATLVVARPDEHKDPTALLDTVRREEITTIHFVPSMLRAVLDHPALGGCTSLVRVVCSGEALPAEFRDRFFERLPGVELHNLYGPTEAAVDVTAFRCSKEDGSPVVPIGKPIANTQIYILDRTGQLVPVGIPGELHIGGANVGLGYLRRPELDAERFVADPFGSARGAKLYRTGDLARWLPSGDVEFLGRLDSQVKVRGMRIELGEIESTLRAHPGVADAAVVVRSDGDDRKQLVAYAVPAGGDTATTTATTAATTTAQPTSRRQGLFDEYMKSDAPVGGPEQLATPSARALVGELREHLRASLPDFMIPHAFVVLARLPITTSGKLDRRALPAPLRPGSDEPAGEAPRTPTERTLAAIWADVLGIEHVAVDGNFFELGGDSIDSIQVVARATEAGLRVTPADIVRHPSVRRLATAIGEVAEPAVAAASSSLTGEVDRLAALGLDVEDVHPLSRYQTEMLRRKLTDGPASLYVQSIETRMRSTTGQPIDLDALEAAWRAVVERHSVLRSSFRWADVDEPELVVHRSAEIVVERHDLAGMPQDARGGEIHRWVESVREGGFALDRPGHLRVGLFPGDRPDEIGMAFLYNYMFSDGWSLSFVLADLLVLLGDPQAELAPVVPYRHYIDHQRARDDDAVAAFWRRSMAAFEVTPLVAALGGTPSAPDRGGAYLRSDASVSAEATGALRELARGAGLTLSNVVLAAWALVLARWTGHTRVSFGNMMTGRSADVAGYERMVGIFTSVLPMQLDVPLDRTFLEWVEQAQRLQLDLDAHHHVALEEIRGWAGRPAGADLYESCFVFLNFPFSSDGEEARRRTELRIVEGQTQTEHPLRVAVFAFGDALDLQFFHYERQLPAAAVEEVKTAFRDLLERLADAATEPVGRLLASVRRGAN